MPSGIYKRGIIVRKPHSEETKKKFSDAKKANPPTFWKGKKFSDKHRENMSKAMKGKPKPGLMGDKNHNWKGGLTKINGYISWQKNQWSKRKRNADGNHSFNDWENMKAQYNWTCPCCHKSEPEIKLTEDHIIPLSKGGSDNIENIQPLCKSCNCKKKVKVIKY